MEVAVGQRVLVPDPQEINPFGSPPGPHGPGKIVVVSPPKYEGGAPMLTVKMDSGEEIRVGSMFVRAEEA